MPEDVDITEAVQPEPDDVTTEYENLDPDPTEATEIDDADGRMGTGEMS